MQALQEPIIYYVVYKAIDEDQNSGYLLAEENPGHDSKSYLLSLSLS